MKKLLFMFLTISLIALLAACGSNNEDTQSDNNAEKEGTEETASLHDKVMEEGVLTVGTEGTYAPFTFHNESGELTGYDVEVVREVGKRMGVEVKFEETQWDSMFAGLNAERFDLIANQVGINEERLANYDFSVPYTYSAAVVVVPEDNTSITSFEDLEGKKSAQSLTSNFGAIAKENGAEIEGVEGLAQSIELIKQGRVDVTVNDKLAVLDYMNQQKDAGIKIVAQEESVSETALAFRKGNEDLVEAINEQLEAMKEDGTLSEIAKEWFGEDVSSK
ncbi:amino acid ABC transporter substrate-binding protein [Radiobacillus kanasensis]|uniref:amino acid ABC transporter substrate-binding protein n=1 Tax=Radiobacillus kanasensis TaxID=2844358 RepID=UPI001E3DF176|nr:amino acid ABC transporter substrate-binding protein [Radiobacillus kanasensis]UFT99684.1 amino acid ABC transporter substrate-binding protein [Radiobacillus kanasensis]